MLNHFKTSLFILLSTFTFAQEKYNISGTITDGSSGEGMIGAKISVINQSGLGKV